MRLVLILLCLACTRAPVEDSEEQDVNGCGTERWAIKTGTDANAFNVVQKPIAGTIAGLVALPMQTGNDTDRIVPTEYIAYQLTDVNLLEFRRESDGDYHLVLSDGSHTMLAEIPDPACVAGGPLQTPIAAARAQFEARYPGAGAATVVNETVTVAGVGFFDFLHSQTGVAPNAIELHPVLSICFGAKCAGPGPSGGPPPVTHTGCATADLAPWLALAPLLRRRRKVGTQY